jgi:hypothetical protein
MGKYNRRTFVKRSAMLAAPALRDSRKHNDENSRVSTSGPNRHAVEGVTPSRIL